MEAPFIIGEWVIEPQLNQVTGPRGRVTVEPVYCLGLCACGPAAMVDGAVRGRVQAETLVAEVAE